MEPVWFVLVAIMIIAYVDARRLRSGRGGVIAHS